MRHRENMQPLRACICHTRLHLYHTMRILKMIVKITNLINESTGCFVLNYMLDAFQRFFFSLRFCCFERSPAANGIIRAFVLYFLWFILFMKASVGGSQYSKELYVISKRFIAITDKTRKTQQMNKSTTWKAP